MHVHGMGLHTGKVDVGVDVAVGRPSIRQDEYVCFVVLEIATKRFNVVVTRTKQNILVVTRLLQSISFRW